jgi:hypothetical protein
MPKPSSKPKRITRYDSHEALKADERAYWHSRTPHERLEALELLRQTFYGYKPAADRVQRVLRIVELDLDDLENLP